MIFEDIVNSIENSDKITNKDWINYVDALLKDEIEYKQLYESKWLFYILVMINMKKVKYNEYTQKIHSSIIKYYKENKPLLGLQVIIWYQSKENIKKSIDYSLHEIGYTFKEANLFLLEWLIKNKKLSKIRKEILNYMIRILSNKSTFDFELYREAAKVRFSRDYSDVCEYITAQMEKNNIKDIFVEYINNTINIYEKKHNNFKELDEIISFYIRENLFEIQLMSRLEKNFDELISNNLDNKNIVFIDYVDKMKNICINSDIDFLNTKVCKELIYSYIFRYNSDQNLENEKILEQYLYKNKKKVLTDRTSFNIINAYISGKLKITIKKLNRIDYKILYEEKINNLIKLNNEERKKFLIELNKIKLSNGLIPYNICRYVIYCILKYNEFKDIQECILCDFATNIERNNEIYDVMNYIDETNEMIFINGLYSHLQYIKLNEDLIENFPRKNVKILDTLYHEIEHVLQNKDIKEKNFYGNRYKMYIEGEISKKIRDYNKLNYYNLYIEIEARLAGAIKLAEFLDDIKLNKDEYFVFGESVSEYVERRIAECKVLLKRADLKKISINEEKNIMDIWQKVKSQKITENKSD